MDLAQFVHTVRYLKPRQLVYRGFYAARKRFGGEALRSVSGAHAGHSLNLAASIPRAHSNDENRFSFLNLQQEFSGAIDWDFQKYGRLWTYNLNYFDFLNQEGMSKDRGLELIHQFLTSLDGLETAWEPYPTSLRLVNWIKFLSCEKVRDPAIDKSLYVQSVNLTRQLEYHLLGNHLLENGFGLLFAAVFFADSEFLRLAREILEPELKEQVLADGAHFELSPMYHQILLDRLLDCINLLQNNRPLGEDLLPLLTDKASAMLGWLEKMTFANGEIPLFNDAACGIAPFSSQLFEYAERLGVQKKTLPLGESGYRRFESPGAELLVDVGAIGPDYIPGHAHADTLNFELALWGERVIVDTGTSTYEKNAERQRQRGTAAHNTVTIDGQDSSEVWGGFRVARRARPFGLKIDEQPEKTTISCAHDGYRRLPRKPGHSRCWEFGQASLTVVDTVAGEFVEAVARYHFHPDVQVAMVDNKRGIGRMKGGKEFSFWVISGVPRLCESTWHPEFNVSLKNTCLEVALEGKAAAVRFEWNENEDSVPH
ncbi:putative heparinase superfamily protein [Geothermobacter ehrlichii]|uniref:Putative heparinase superfamily protein n=1 Tax=Geothermobacter ehrlichii TaxID=213224 RepID=A0A5D3WKC2_9BACT|nr:heparinase II/III family protein [Geothermobacter ehrlichii]TYO98350.1 putative heparinase superfamily protein [Geothermobacter ehrlichii]